MPCTFFHPLAVVPLRRFCPGRLNFAALVIGSMSPDFGYYVHQFPVASFAHSFWGTLIVCVPSGLLALGLFYLLRRPLCFILPRPHRTALMPLARRSWSFSWRGLVVAVLSILLGAWTHAVWDAFTHDGAWFVERFAILRAPIAQVGESQLPLSYILQQTSTFVGGALLAVLYFRWLKRQQPVAGEDDGAVSDRWRYLLIGTVVVLALAVAIPFALGMASRFEGYLAFRVFVFRTGVYSAAAFLPIFVIAAVLFYSVRRKNA